MSISKSDAAIVQFLADRQDGCTAQEFVEKFSVVMQSARDRLWRASRRKIVVCIGRNKMARWVLPQHAAALRAQQEQHKAEVLREKQARHAERRRLERDARPARQAHRHAAFEAAKFEPIEREPKFKRVRDVWQFGAEA